MNDATATGLGELNKLRGQVEHLTEHLQRLTDIGLALSGEQNRERLFEMIVGLARRITNADAGTLYIVDESDRELEFAVLQNDTMGDRLGGTSGKPITLKPVPLYDAEGRPNHANVSSHVALAREVVNIPDVYEAEGFDFTGTRRYDAATGYRSRSMLTIPMENHEREIIGVLQLLNAKDPVTGEVTAFSSLSLAAVQSLATQAAVALTNTQLIHGLKALLYSFMQSIAKAIDAKSPYTRGHIDRVVELTMRLAVAVNAQARGPFGEKAFTPNELEEIKLAAWMHDMGKITTPVRVVDKGNKLEALTDRIELVRTRFGLIGKSLEAAALARSLERSRAGAGREELDALAADLDARLAALAEDLAFIEECNLPREFMPKESVERLREIAARTYEDGGRTLPWLTENELLNLSVQRGSLTDAERQVINDHVKVTQDMLGTLTFPKRLARVPEYAGDHHEKLDGTGYPNRKPGEALALQARILAVADVFEALTARDRPYKKPMPLSKAVSILESMSRAGHVDSHVFELLRCSDVMAEYARKHLNPAQVDLPLAGGACPE